MQKTYQKYIQSGAPDKDAGAVQSLFQRNFNLVNTSTKQWDVSLQVDHEVQHIKQ